MSIATILPALTVKPATEKGLPFCLVTTPTAPLIRASSIASPNREKVIAWRAIASAPRTSPDPRAGPRSALSTAFEASTVTQSVEVSTARGFEEGLDDLTLSLRIGVRDGLLDPHAATCPTGQLACRLRRAVDDLSDLVEGHREHVVQHKREPLGRAERLEHYEQGEPH